MKSYKAMAYAIQAHTDTNHTYDGLPYTVHLGMVVSYAHKYIHLIPEPYRDDVIDACWLHDVIGDCRKSFNDVVRASNSTVAEMVYAVTNEKGKSRSERADERYYQGIRRTMFALFVKMCDRLANVLYSQKVNAETLMIEQYRKENNSFLAQMFPGNKYAEPIFDAVCYESMVEELNQLTDASYC